MVSRSHLVTCLTSLRNGRNPKKEGSKVKRVFTGDEWRLFMSFSARVSRVTSGEVPCRPRSLSLRSRGTGLRLGSLVPTPETSRSVLGDPRPFSSQDQLQCVTDPGSWGEVLGPFVSTGTSSGLGPPRAEPGCRALSVFEVVTQEGLDVDVAP